MSQDNRDILVFVVFEVKDIFGTLVQDEMESPVFQVVSLKRSLLGLDSFINQGIQPQREFCLVEAEDLVMIDVNSVELLLVESEIDVSGIVVP